MNIACGYHSPIIMNIRFFCFVLFWLYVYSEGEGTHYTFSVGMACMRNHRYTYYSSFTSHRNSSVSSIHQSLFKSAFIFGFCAQTSHRVHMLTAMRSAYICFWNFKVKVNCLNESECHIYVWNIIYLWKRTYTNRLSSARRQKVVHLTISSNSIHFNYSQIKS